MDEPTPTAAFMMCGSCGARYSNPVEDAWLATCSCDPETPVAVRSDGDLVVGSKGWTKAERAAMEGRPHRGTAVGQTWPTHHPVAPPVEAAPSGDEGPVLGTCGNWRLTHGLNPHAWTNFCIGWRPLGAL